VGLNLCGDIVEQYLCNDLVHDSRSEVKNFQELTMVNVVKTQAERERMVDSLNGSIEWLQDQYDGAFSQAMMVQCGYYMNALHLLHLERRRLMVLVIKPKKGGKSSVTRRKQAAS
jgi:hypothetical protein